MYDAAEHICFALMLINVQSLISFRMITCGIWKQQHCL